MAYLMNINYHHHHHQFYVLIVNTNAPYSYHFLPWNLGHSSSSTMNEIEEDAAMISITFYGCY